LGAGTAAVWIADGSTTGALPRRDDDPERRWFGCITKIAGYVACSRQI
jgi:hypothetical protein